MTLNALYSSHLKLQIKLGDQMRSMLHIFMMCNALSFMIFLVEGWYGTQNETKAGNVTKTDI